MRRGEEQGQAAGGSVNEQKFIADCLPSLVSTNCQGYTLTRVLWDVWGTKARRKVKAEGVVSQYPFYYPAPGNEK